MLFLLVASYLAPNMLITTHLLAMSISASLLVILLVAVVAIVVFSTEADKTISEILCVELQSLGPSLMF